MDEMLRYYSKIKKYQNFNINNHLPDAYTLNFSQYKINQTEKQFFNLDPNINNDPWIYKPINEAQGRGIQIFKSLSEAQQFCRQEKNKNKKEIKYNKVLIQKYIKDIPTWNNKKFDLRCYIFIANTKQNQYQAYYEAGVFRISQIDYVSDGEQKITNFNNLSKHLTNTSLQTKNKNSKYTHDQLLRNWNQFQSYLSNEIKLSNNKIKQIEVQTKQLVTFLTEAFFQKLKEKNYDFIHTDLYGIDIMYDKNWIPQIIEGNTSPQIISKNQIMFDRNWIPQDKKQNKTNQNNQNMLDSMNKIIFKSMENQNNQKINNTQDISLFNSNLKINSLELIIDEFKQYNYIENTQNQEDIQLYNKQEELEKNVIKQKQEL